MKADPKDVKTANAAIKSVSAALSPKGKKALRSAVKKAAQGAPVSKKG